MKNTSVKARIENSNLIINTKNYGEIRFYIYSDRLSTLRFDSGNCSSEVEKIYRSIDCLSAEDMELESYSMGSELQFTINRVTYSHLEVNVRIRNGCISNIWGKASKAGGYSSFCELSTSAYEKLKAELTSELSDSILINLDALLKATKLEAFNSIRSKLQEYKNNVDATINHFELLTKGNHLDLVKQQIKNDIKGKNYDRDLLDDLFLTAVNEREVFDRFKEIGNDWKRGNLIAVAVKANVTNAIYRFLKKYHAEFIKQPLSYVKWHSQTLVHIPLVLEVLEYYSSDDYNLFS